MTSVGLSLFNYQEDARSSKHNILILNLNYINLEKAHYVGVYCIITFECTVRINVKKKLSALSHFSLQALVWQHCLSGIEMLYLARPLCRVCRQQVAGTSVLCFV